eukprot:12707399-Prorocentrum_lima.AAC.1
MLLFKPSHRGKSGARGKTICQPWRKATHRKSLVHAWLKIQGACSGCPMKALSHLPDDSISWAARAPSQCKQDCK